MFPGMDPTTLMSMFSMLFGGPGGAGGGGAQGGAMPPTAGIPNVAGAGAMPMSTGAAPMPPSMDPTTGMPTGDPAMPPNAPPMSQSPGVSYPQSQAMTGIGDALEPKPAPVPMPMARPPGLGQGTPGNYGGSPETNPLLKPIGSPATPKPPLDIAKLLGGITKPAGPDVVKPSTPAQPQRGQMGQSELMQLLQALMPGAGRGMRMPTTLGQAMDLKPSAWGGVYG